MHGKVYSACVRSAMLHGSETWEQKVADLNRLRRNDRAMIRWMCHTKVGEEIDTELLLQKLGIDDTEAVLRCRRLRWYGHVQRASSCIKTVTNFPFPGNRKQGGCRKTWSKCVEDDIEKIRESGLSDINQLDRDALRTAVRRHLLLPTLSGGKRTAP